MFKKKNYKKELTITKLTITEKRIIDIMKKEMILLNGNC